MFRCKHRVAMQDMKDIEVAHQRTGGWGLGYGLLVEYHGYYYECGAEVRKREEVESRALYEVFLRNQKKSCQPEKAED